MRYLILLIFLSCSGKSDQNSCGYFSEHEISIDTIRIEANNEILYLKGDIIGADVSKDKKYLYNFNPYDHTLEEINLNEHRLDCKIPFDREGPNGTGQITSRIQVYGKDKIVIQGNVFSMDGQKLTSVNPRDLLLNWANGDYPISKPIFNDEMDKLFTVINDFENKRNVLGIIDIADQEVYEIPLDNFKDFKNFTFTLQGGSGSVRTTPNLDMDKFDSKLVVSNQVTSTLLVYDISLDTMHTKKYQTSLFNNEKINSYKLTHEIEAWEDYQLEYSRFYQEINFLAPFWDEKNQIYYRFSFKELPTASKTVDHIKCKVYITALDKDFNLLGEIEVPKFTKIPIEGTFRKFPKHFAKDGNIWIFENLMDEMGFVRINLSES
ncbi:DUF4221 family protein [Belliella marina]|uniref:DUF4221 family protein n=1 Tax=Belliella marina TaxID=1644146 RepID=A0ABW4VN80_9BACT